MQHKMNRILETLQTIETPATSSCLVGLDWIGSDWPKIFLNQVKLTHVGYGRQPGELLQFQTHLWNFLVLHTWLLLHLGARSKLLVYRFETLHNVHTGLHPWQLLSLYIPHSCHLYLSFSKFQWFQQQQVVHFAMPQYHIHHEPLCVYVGMFCVSAEHPHTIKFNTRRWHFHFIFPINA